MNQSYEGAYTAILTPFVSSGDEVDFEGLCRLAEFQAENHVSGIVCVGTTGESPTLTWDEHKTAFEVTYDAVGSRTTIIASTGSNSTLESLVGTEHAKDVGIGHVLLVDPYYNGPSSLEIRKEYLEPVAAAFPNMGVIPYIIPGRSGTQLLPQDLALARERYPNIRGVKEATGDMGNAKLTRKLCGDGFSVLSGDDDRTLQLMLEAEVKASGVISVVSNVAPRSVQTMCDCATQGRVEEASSIARALQPLFDIVTVKTNEETGRGAVVCKARNPLPIKTLAGILGLPGGPCRRPLGRMTEQGVNVVLDSARKVNSEHPEVFEPLAEYFDVDVTNRLTDSRYLEGWYYDGY